MSITLKTALYSQKVLSCVNLPELNRFDRMSFRLLTILLLYSFQKNYLLRKAATHRRYRQGSSKIKGLPAFPFLEKLIQKSFHELVSMLSKGSTGGSIHQVFQQQ